MSFITRTGCLIAIAALLSGCHTSAPPSAVSASTQVNQLASLIAGNAYLRDHCSQQRIASDETLYKQAVQLAHKRGWNTGQAEYQTLRTLAEERKRQLLNDPTTSEVKCTALHSAIGPLS